MRRIVASVVMSALVLMGLFAAAPAQAAVPKYKLSVHTTGTKSPVAGRWIHLAGTTSKRLAKSHLQVQRRTGSGHWSKVGSATVTRSGTFKTRVRATGVGKVQYRVHLSKSRRARSANSARTMVTVFRYYYLSDLDPISTEIEGAAGGCTGGCTGFDSGSASIAGTTHSRSYLTNLSARRLRSVSVWNASYRCRSFTATIGLDDESVVSPARFTFNVGGDDETLADQLTVGTAVAVHQDLTGVFRFTIAAVDEGDRDIYEHDHLGAVWGDARLLCSGKP